MKRLVIGGFFAIISVAASAMQYYPGQTFNTRSIENDMQQISANEFVRLVDLRGNGVEVEDWAVTRDFNGKRFITISTYEVDCQNHEARWLAGVGAYYLTNEPEMVHIVNRINSTPLNPASGRNLSRLCQR
ncbi:hypothetical protein HZU75_08245 [Chitinibacter fontanus]|uniref:Uncharacterized protein n=1 Tax=Chitinibacter fontanus TaxID=1737446 RepID=A0A7D5VAA4_9NEIS|nr:hypothetical protein [Chitinibacter fontanus]QLI81520.1 hypothetical protein HZU75_08245 [Chitinibacter fontanus]